MASGNRLPQATRRVTWSLADQALSSLTNFLFGLLVAHATGAAGFGAFGVVFGTYTVLLGVTRGLCTDPLVVRHSADDQRRWHVATARATGAAVVLAVLAGAGCVLVGLFASGALRGGFLALGIVLPGLLVQETWRHALLARGRGAAAFLNDLTWVAGLLAVLLLLATFHLASILSLTLAWGGTATVAALVGVAQTRIVPTPVQVRQWMQEQRDLVTRYVCESIASTGAEQFATYGIGAMAGLAAVGTIRAVGLLLGPLNVLFVGAGLFVVPELVRRRHADRSGDAVLTVSIASAVGLAAASLAFGIALLALPGWAGRALLGSIWGPALQILVPLTLMMAASGVVTGAQFGLRASAAAHRSLRARLVASTILVASATGGAAVGSTHGAAVGLAVALWASSAVWWRELIQAVRGLRLPGDRPDGLDDRELANSHGQRRD